MGWRIAIAYGKECKRLRLLSVVICVFPTKNGSAPFPDGINQPDGVRALKIVEPDDLFVNFASGAQVSDLSFNLF